MSAIKLFLIFGGFLMFACAVFLIAISFYQSYHSMEIARDYYKEQFSNSCQANNILVNVANAHFNEYGLNNLTHLNCSLLMEIP